MEELSRMLDEAPPSILSIPQMKHGIAPLPINTASRKWRQEDQKLMATFVYIMSSRPAWDTWEYLKQITNVLK